MADVRALLAAERQSRRISHPHLSYSKSGALTCTICNLNVKSEQLWPGHLKSANHRANIQRSIETVQPPIKAQKRKHEDLEDPAPIEREYNLESRKKPRPAADNEQSPPTLLHAPADEVERSEVIDYDRDEFREPGNSPDMNESSAGVPAIPTQQPLDTSVDEDEWAAFERDIASVPQHDYSSATITAAPVSAAEIAAQHDAAAAQPAVDEAEEEKQEESRRMEEEFDVMEEMEERIKRLKEKREALRSKDSSHTVPANSLPTPTAPPDDVPENGSIALDEDEEDEEDDWYT